MPKRRRPKSRPVQGGFLRKYTRRYNGNEGKPFTLSAYEAVLRGDRLEWKDAVPREAHGDERTVYILFPAKVSAENEKTETAVSDEQGERMAAALERIAAAGGIPSIPDPVEWQREQRKDRALPGR